MLGKFWAWPTNWVTYSQLILHPTCLQHHQKHPRHSDVGPKQHGFRPFCGRWIAHFRHSITMHYPLVIQHSYWTWPIEIVDLPIKDGDFPWQTVRLPKGTHCFKGSKRTCPMGATKFPPLQEFWWMLSWWFLPERRAMLSEREPVKPRLWYHSKYHSKYQ